VTHQGILEPCQSLWPGDQGRMLSARLPGSRSFDEVFCRGI